jgi:putative transcriptional regulator
MTRFFYCKRKKVTEIYTEITDEFYLTEDIENIISAVLSNELDINNVKIFSGYSGWTAFSWMKFRKNWT